MFPIVVMEPELSKRRIVPEVSRTATAVPSRPTITDEIAPVFTSSATEAPAPTSTATANKSRGAIIFARSKKTSSIASLALAMITPVLLI